MTAARWLALAERLLNGDGASTISWTRRALASNGPAGTVTVTDSDTYSVRAAQLGPGAKRMYQDASWQQSSLFLVLSASGLPFAAEAHSGHADVRFDDLVLWLGETMRVLSVQTIVAPGGPGLPPVPCVLLVGLGA